MILYFCKRYELDQSRTHLLLSELESAQNQSQKTLTEEEIKLISANKIQKRLKKANYDPNLMMVSLVLKFVDSDLIRFLVLNKQAN